MEIPLPFLKFNSSLNVLRTMVAISGVTLAAACTTPGPGEAPGGVFDPYEVQNRRVHEFNRGLDKALLRPAGKGYSKVVPVGLQDSISNFSDNVALPGVVVNNLLQGDLKNGGINTYRFVVNTVLGIGGMVDAASLFGIPKNDTDFGETLHVWGVPEGAYVEMPVLGPATERDATGRIVDFFTNPLSYVLPKPEKYVGTASHVIKKIGDRGRYSDTVDSVLYESADSYAASRTIYLQNRRFNLGDESSAGNLDPYEDAYEDPYDDPYAE